MANCPECGKELPQGSKFCPFCGETVKKDSHIVLALQSVFTSTLLPITALLFTVASAAALLFDDKILPFEITTSVAMWMAVAAGRHNNKTAYKTPLKVFRAIALIDTAIMWVVSGIFGLTGVFLLIFGEGCLDEMMMLGEHIHGLEILTVFKDPLLTSSQQRGVLIACYGIILLLTGALQAAITYFIYTKIHHCAESVLLSFQLEENRTKHLKLTKIVILVLAVVSALGLIEGLFGHPAAYISSMCSVAGETLVFVLLGRFEKRLNEETIKIQNKKEI